MEEGRGRGKSRAEMADELAVTRGNYVKWPISN